MTEYRPDSWVPVRINSKKHGIIHKVLCSWYGGFAGSDYWKLSSGIESVTIEGATPTDHGTLIMPQSSGSVYIVPGRTHMSGLMMSIASSFAQKAEDSNGEFTFEIIELEDLLDTFCTQ